MHTLSRPPTPHSTQGAWDLDQEWITNGLKQFSWNIFPVLLSKNFFLDQCKDTLIRFMILELKKERKKDNIPSSCRDESPVHQIKSVLAKHETTAWAMAFLSMISQFGQQWTSLCSTGCSAAPHSCPTCPVAPYSRPPQSTFHHDGLLFIRVSLFQKTA